MKSFLSKVLVAVLIAVLVIYSSSILIKQEKELNKITAEITEYEKLIDKAMMKTEELKETKNNINSLEYIEKIAREKLNMYLPNEKVYIDVTQ